ncbi:MAG: acetylxylan esterase, partial [Armatimonadota bacterium]|nr:acetylxylan esterase [Armatimonadota bacterium]
MCIPLPDFDRRAVEVRHLNRHYPLPRYETLDAWQARAAELRAHVLASTGLLPMPVRAPLNPRVWGTIEGDGYFVDKVTLETLPGFYLGGNLYRPKGKRGPFPGIANPHGHWRNGRLEHQELGSIPARCITFARMGCVAFAYDMVGRTDTDQVPHDYGGPREALWGISVAGLQLWNSIRVLDYLQSLPDVDPERLGCTGASGGGTQTFLLCAVDERVKVAAPVNMVSAHMQGGCLCENPPNLRIDATNVEIAALMAPRPLLLVAATGDWTKNTLTEEFPFIQSIYRLMGAEERVGAQRFDAPHNYNRASREAVYVWFAQWLLGDPGAALVPEPPIDLEDPS